MMKDGADLLRAGQRLEGRWVVGEKLGSGGFGQVYAASDEEKKRDVALKVEPKGKKAVLHIEAKLMEELSGRPHIPDYYGFGNNSSINYLVMEILGKNLSDLRRESPSDRCCFSLRTASALAIQTLEAIEGFHRSYVHRDIKPGNFVMGKSGTPRQSVAFIIDYGLARPIWDKNKNLRPPRPQSGFRGTVKYASPAAHDFDDLGRKDDLWSHFYMTLEMVRGTLPWRRLKEKEDVGRCKKTVTMETLCDAVPATLVHYGQALQPLTFASEPPYAEIRSILDKTLRGALPPALLTKAAATKQPLHLTFKLDWEEAWFTAKKEEAVQGGLQRLPSAPGMTHTGAATGKTTVAAGSQVSLPLVQGFKSPAAKTKSTPSAAPAKLKKAPSANTPLRKPNARK